MTYDQALKKAKDAYAASMSESRDDVASFVRNGLVMLREEMSQELSYPPFLQVMESQKEPLDKTLTGPTFYRFKGDGMVEYYRARYTKQGSTLVADRPENGTMELEDVPYESLDGRDLFNLAQNVERALQEYKMI